MREKDRGKQPRELAIPSDKNLFVDFVTENRENFESINGLSRELRQTRRSWQQAFIPIQQGIIDVARTFTRNTSQLRRVEDKFTNYVFGKPDSSLSSGSETADDITEEEKDPVRNLSEYELRNLAATQYSEINNRVLQSHRDLFGALKMPEIISQFKKDYDAAMVPLSAEIHKLKKILWEETINFMLSSYQGLIDMQTVLSDSNSPSFNKIKDEIGIFFGGLMSADEEDRRTGEESLTTHIRSQWHESARSNFDPVLFERFWVDARRSGKANDIIDWLTFGALVARAQRDEAREEDITSHDIETAIGRISLEKWPRQLREAYVKFGITDTTLVIEKIRSRCKELFPSPSEKKISVVDKTSGNDFGVAKAKSAIDIKSPPLTAQMDQISKDSEQKENGNGQVFGMGKSKYISDRINRITHHLIYIPSEAVESEIVRLASYGNTQGMRNDFAKIIRRMLNDPTVLFGPAAIRFRGHDIRIANDKAIPLRRLDPKKTDITLEDPETRHARIVFAIDGNTLIFYRVFPTHDSYTTHFGMDK